MLRQKEPGPTGRDPVLYARAKEVFRVVLDAPATERSTVLDRECTDDAALRAEVESLLAHHAPESIIENWENRENRPGVGGLPGTEPLPVGRKVGSYLVVRLLGQGGMGSVYEGVHQYIERRAAIKILHPHLSRNREVSQRFLNEARAVNLIKHPGLIEIFEFGFLEDGTPHIIMELLEGEPLSQLMHRNPDGLGLQALSICRQIAQAMSVAHAKGIVHRDLKPADIMLV